MNTPIREIHSPPEAKSVNSREEQSVSERLMDEIHRLGRLLKAATSPRMSDYGPDTPREELLIAVNASRRIEAENARLREKKKALDVELGLAGDYVDVCQGPCPGGCGRQVHKASWCLSCYRTKLVKDNANLRAALEKYGQHLHTLGPLQRSSCEEITGGECDCGLDDATACVTFVLEDQ